MPILLWPVSLLLALAQGGADQERAAEAWKSLPMPSLSVAPPVPAAFPRLLTGRHVALPGDDPQPEVSVTSASLPIPALMELLQEDAASRRQVLRLQPQAPPLLARGESAVLAGAQTAIEGLDQQGAALDIAVRAWLVPGASQRGTHAPFAEVEKAVAGAPPLGTASVRSGAEVVLGARTAQSFLAGYTVEIAAGSGVAAPALGSVLTGRTLHLRASRVRDGAAVALEGFLDLSELAEIKDFEPGTADLGRLQQPRVLTLQAAFAGIVEPETALCVSIAGAPLAQPDWTLWIVARSIGASQPVQSAWRARDVAFFAEPVLDLPVPRPGSVLEPLFGAERDAQTLAQPLGPAEVAQAADAARTGGGRSRSPIVWGGGLVLAPTGESALWAEIEGLIAAAEAEHLRESEIEISQGQLRVRLPLLGNRPARVLAAEERALVAGYDLQVAQDTWMPHPQVRCTLDGLLVQGRAVGGRFEGAAWRSASIALVELDRKDTGLARLQLETRGLESAALRVESGASVAPLPASEGAAELALAYGPLR
jgi:hypothetical protein